MNDKRNTKLPTYLRSNGFALLLLFGPLLDLQNLPFGYKQSSVLVASYIHPKSVLSRIGRYESLSSFSYLNTIQVNEQQRWTQRKRTKIDFAPNDRKEEMDLNHDMFSLDSSKGNETAVVADNVISSLREVGNRDLGTENEVKENELTSLLRSFNTNLFSKPSNTVGRGRPPFDVEDTTLLLYDVFLLLNLSLSVSFWVVHRMSLEYIAPAFSEGSLLCILWIAAGLYNGAFLYSARDGHYNMNDDAEAPSGGPMAAGKLGLFTFITTINFRIVLALAMAFVQHRHVGSVVGEQLIPLELEFGLVLMSMWRMLHSSFSAR